MIKEDTRRERAIFYSILGISFVLILLLNLLTPFLSDDYGYLAEVEKAGSFFDLFRQEYHQYLTWNGRSVAHFLLRVFLYLPRPVFKIANSLAFVCLSVLISRMAVPRRTGRWEIFPLLLSQIMLWLFSVDISETILWEDGACNYLWGTLIILGFMSCAREAYEKNPAAVAGHAGAESVSGSAPGKTAVHAVLLFFFGVAAGWCNENTSGGCLLFIMILLFRSVRLRKGRQTVLPLSTALAGNAVGLALMVLSPGEHLRASYDTDENYTGLLRYLSRFQKVTLTIRDNFGIILAVLVVCMVILLLQRNRKVWERSALFLFLFLATSYAMILARPTQPRAFFGAGIFLDIAVISAVYGIVRYEREHRESGTGYILRAGCYGVAGVLLLVFFFHYVDDGTSLARVYRDETARVAYIEEQAANGAEEIDVFQIHPAFYNDYSAIGKMEMTDDDGFWINLLYEQYFGIEKIHAIPYDVWEQMTESNPD